jgi:hypothetical protein
MPVLKQQKKSGMGLVSILEIVHNPSHKEKFHMGPVPLKTKKYNWDQSHMHENITNGISPIYDENKSIVGINPMCKNIRAMGIGGKSYGTREQCSQKLFELTENIRKISLFSDF